MELYGSESLVVNQNFLMFIVADLIFLIVTWFSPMNSVCWVSCQKKRKMFVFLLSRWFNEWDRLLLHGCILF